MNMKIGLLTTHSAVNYGAVLQAYALRKTIENLGHYCEIINLQTNEKVTGRRMNYTFNNIKDFLNSIYIFINLPYRRKITKKINKFDQFLEAYCVLTKDRYSTYLELHNKMPEYDCLVCGSDQIWNLNLSNNPAFFLRFEDVYPRIGYIAYGPSIAEKLTDLQYSRLAANIAHFSAISVREKDGAEIISRLIGKPVKNVLDPVFLIDKNDWGDILSSTDISMDIKVPYILLYSVSGDRNYTEVVKKIRKKLGYKVVCINTTTHNKYCADKCFYDASPQDFVWLVKNAEFVCTSSFHGIAFSIIFERQFCSIPSKRRSSRQESLLRLLSLNDRLLYDSSLLDNTLLSRINYSLVDKRLNELKNESLDFLKTSLNNVEGDK